MKKKLFVFFSFLFFLCSQLAHSQTNTEELSSADSLFNQKKYTEAYQKYLHLLKNEGQYSPQMLLKMAYIKEGLEEYPEALYFLSLYYKKNPNKKVLQKMEELAENQKYEGYQFGDAAYFFTLYQQNHNYIMGGLFAVFAGVLAFLVRKKRQNKPILYPIIAFGVFVLGFAYLYNFGSDKQEGIVRDEQVLLMEAPSAGSKTISTSGSIKGYRFEIVGKKDIWYAVKWEDGVAYIREHHMLVI